MPRRASEDVDYDISPPIESESWFAQDYIQSKTDVIWIGQYGLRYLAGNTSTNRQDIHGGMDTNKRFSNDGINYDCDEGAKPKIYSVCDGKVYKFRDQKNDVFIECDQLLMFADGQTSTMRTIYRHMSSVRNEVKVGDGQTYTIKKGDYIGEMGSKGANNCHLHFDLKDQDEYLHPGRLFNPNSSAYFSALKSTDDIDFRMLGYEEDTKEAYFRIAIKGNVLSILEIKIENSSTDFSRKLNFEEQQEIDETSEKDNSLFEDWAIFAYPFNGYQHAEDRYEGVMKTLPEIYPGSGNREKFYPVSSEDHTLYGEASLVYDITVFNVERIDLPYFKITMCDLYGNCIATK